MIAPATMKRTAARKLKMLASSITPCLVSRTASYLNGQFAGLRLKLVDNKGEQDDVLFAAEAAIPVSKSLSPASEDRSDEPYDSDSQRHKDGIMEPANGRQPLNHILW